jgi:hypothetical protein
LNSFAEIGEVLAAKCDEAIDTDTPSIPRYMRRNDYILEAPKWMVGWQRLFLEHVQRRQRVGMRPKPFCKNWLVVNGGAKPGRWAAQK